MWIDSPSIYHNKTKHDKARSWCIILGVFCIFSSQWIVVLHSPGGWFNIKTTSYQYRKSHCGDKTILRPSYLHNGISYTGKMTSLYWIRTQYSFGLLHWQAISKVSEIVMHPGVPLTLIAACINNHMHRKVCIEITYPFPNFNAYSADVWEWISNFMLQYMMCVITYPSWD